MIHPPTSIVYNHHSDFHKPDDSIFQFEDIHEHRPEFEQYCMKLEQQEEQTSRSNRVRSDSIPINSNGISPDELDAETEYLYNVERAKRKESEMFDLISRRKATSLDSLPQANISSMSCITLESCLRLEYLSNIAYESQNAAWSNQPFLYVGPLHHPPLVSFLPIDANVTFNSTLSGLERILHYAGEAISWCDDIANLDSHEEIFEIDL